MKNRALVCLRMETGEMLFVETTGVVDEMGFLECWYPFVASPAGKGRLAIVPWNHFNTEGDRFAIQASKIHYISGIDDEFRTMYGTLQMGQKISKAKERMAPAMQQGVANADDITVMFDEITLIALDAAKRYGVRVPLTDLKSQFYEFMLEHSNTSTETRQ